MYDEKKIKELFCNKAFIKLITENFISNSDSYTRFYSWDICFKKFCRNGELVQKAKNNDEDAIDTLAINLAFYLASWGMYRGSSFLLNYSYRIHYDAIRIIVEEEYDELYDIKSADCLKSKNITQKMDKIFFELCKLYLEKKKTIKGVEENKISITLITKILLGVFGCIPALDDYFTSSAKIIFGNEYNSLINMIVSNSKKVETKKSVSKLINKLCNWYEKYFPDIKNGENYPIMKRLDMFMWNTINIKKKHEKIASEYCNKINKKKNKENNNINRNDVYKEIEKEDFFDNYKMLIDIGYIDIDSSIKKHKKSKDSQ